MTRSLEQEGNHQRGNGFEGFSRRFDSIDRELRKLWAGVNKRSSGVIDMPFSWSGGPSGVLGDLSAPWVVPGGGELFKVLLTAGEAPTTGPLTVGVYKNGTQITTISLAAGAQRGMKQIVEPFDSDFDLMQVAFTAFGVGAKDVTLQARVRTRG